DADQRSECEVERSPDRRDREDQHRDQDEQCLPRAQVLVVVRVRADERESFGEAVHHARRSGSSRARISARESSPSSSCSGCGGSTCSVRRPPCRTYSAGTIAPRASYSTETAHASPSSWSTKCASGTMPSSRMPPEGSTSRTRARYAFWLQSSGAP